MEFFKAAVLVEQRHPLEIWEVVHRAPIGCEVKVKIFKSCICGAQVNEVSGAKGPDKFLPHMMGHEGYGQVVEVGDQVSKINPGDYVILHWRPSSGGGIPGSSHQTKNDVTLGAGPVTTFSQYSIVAENRCTKIIPNPELEEVYPLLGCAFPTAYGAIVNESGAKSEDRVLILGAGGLGIALTLFLKLLNFSAPVVIDRHSEKRHLVETMGGKFSTTLDPSSNNFSEFDVVFDTTGHPELLKDVLTLSAKAARIILIGQTPHKVSVAFDNFHRIYNGVSIFSSNGGEANPDVDIHKIHDLIKKQPRLVKKIITHRVSLEDINAGFSAIKDPDCGRVLVSSN